MTLTFGILQYPRLEAFFEKAYEVPETQRKGGKGRDEAWVSATSKHGVEIAFIEPYTVTRKPKRWGKTGKAELDAPLKHCLLEN